jgi:hypothetical protein
MKDNQVDMSPRAVAQRLDELRALCDLTSYLGRFRPLAEADEKTTDIDQRPPA